MPFLSLSFCNCRNLKNDTIDLLSKEIYFVGENGQGKSNLLEALYYSAYGNSFRTHTDSQIITYGQDKFSINALYRQENESIQKIRISYENNIKHIEKNGKRIQDRKDLINTIPCVLFCHDDLQFAVGNPECRRFFLDQSLSMYDELYIDDLRNYRKVLKNRNQLLKELKYDLLSVYDQQLAQLGLEVQKKRKKAVFEFNQIFGKLYEDISNISDVSILYEPSWKEQSAQIGTKFPDINDILNILEQKRDFDKIAATTMSGPHRDRVIFIQNSRPFIPSASTGQRRLVALLLRVAQAVYYLRITGRKPVLLMDDVMLELDPDKRQRMTAMLPDYDQLFCTFLPGEPYERYKHSTTRIYFMDKGEWHE
jgi:DNA replication and repair protein RecF